MPTQPDPTAAPGRARPRSRPRARVIVVAGPSGSGKSRLTRRLGLPVLRLDDFYKDGADPDLPQLDLAGGAPVVDWDSPDSWHAERALVAVEQLCRTGSADVPVYDIASSRTVGHRLLDIDAAPYFVAEGIFAQEIVGACQERGLLADAVCLSQHPAVTFARRLWRDLREHRKPPLVLLRRGVRLMRLQRALVAHARELGCRVRSGDRAYAELSALTAD